MFKELLSICMGRRDASGRETRIVECRDCGNTFAGQVFVESGLITTGRSGCPQCESDDFSVVSPEDLGLE